ncbi:MAG: hypothetical protein ACO3LT_06325 [Ilumatobacteraceae bacterium]
MQYPSLTQFCEQRSRQKIFPRRFRERVIATIVADWPEGVTDTTYIEETLRHRCRAAVKQEYGSIVLLILGPLIAELIKLAIQWWLAHRAHRIVMEAWRAEANR